MDFVRNKMAQNLKTGAPTPHSYLSMDKLAKMFVVRFSSVFEKISIDVRNGLRISVEINPQPGWELNWNGCTAGTFPVLHLIFFSFLFRKQREKKKNLCRKSQVVTNWPSTLNWGRVTEFRHIHVKCCWKVFMDGRRQKWRNLLLITGRKKQKTKKSIRTREWN